MTKANERSRGIMTLGALLALAFLGSGAGKLIGVLEMAESFHRFGFGTGFMRFIGVAEIAGAVGLFLPRLAPLAAACLALIMGGAVVQHALHDPLARALPPAVLFVLCAIVTYRRRGELVGGQV